MNPAKLKFTEILFYLGFVIIIIAGIFNIKTGNTLIGVLILIPIGIYVIYDSFKIPKVTLKKLHKKQIKTKSGSLILAIEALGMLVVLYLFVQYYINT